MRREPLLMLASTSLILLASAALNACVVGRGSPSSSGRGYRGAVTVVNQSGLRVCAVDPYVMAERHPGVATEIPPGGSATFEAQRNFDRVQVLECDTQRLLYGDPLAFLADRQMHTQPLAGRITLLPPGSRAAAGDGWSLPLEPVDVEAAVRHFGVAAMSRRDVPDGYRFMADPALASQGLSLMREAVRRAGWTERYTFAMVVSDDWAPMQERRQGAFGWSMATVARRVTLMMGAHHATNACTLRGMDLQEPFDGESSQGPVRLGGVGAVYQIPCALLDAMASQPGAAQD